jgi:3',5'-cyclic-AMP phosphodiesterase
LRPPATYGKESVPIMSLTRRQAFRRAALTGVAGLTGSLSSATPAAPASPESATPRRQRVLRVAFFTDAHVPVQKENLAEKPANARVIRAFARMREEKPDLVIFGGDNIMAVDQGNTEAHARAQFENWTTLVKENVKVPTVSVIGNHDIWYPKDEKPADRKALAVGAFGMPKRYYAVEKKGWKFLLLDTFHENGCHIDDEQMAWLKREIEGQEKNICLVSHASILTASGFIERGKPEKGGWNIPVGWMVANTNELRDLFLKHPNVRLSLSGHMHHLDRVDYDAVTYICGGAVSGSWWGGEYLHFPPAFVMLDLNADGTFQHRVIFWEKEQKK